jgi:flavin-binding monooxygenase-like protein
MNGVCVIGAGSAGLAAAQALSARGEDFTVFEAGSGVGGNWRYENDSGLSSAYASLTTNVSRRRTSYRSFPLPRRGSAYLHHSDMLAYLEAYADHFGLRSRIRFRTPVSEVRRAGDGSWSVRAGGAAEPERFRAVVVATGYNSVPQYPDLPGSFDGLALHTHDYRTAEPFRDLDVVVIGSGCSATELACEVAGTARSVTLAVRSSNWAFPRRVRGVPMDWFDMRLGSRLPWRFRRRLLGPLIQLAGGGEVAVPGQASVRVGDKPHAVSDDLMRRVRRGAIRVTGPVVELAGDRVRLADGTALPAGAILFGTGYRAEFPFLPGDVAPPSLESAPLYRGIAHPDAPGLFFIGLVLTFGALIPVFEAQAGWVAAVAAGDLRLPSTEVMHASIARDAEFRRRNFDPRFGTMWDRLPYLRALEAETRAARRRPGIAGRAAAATVR